MAKLTNKQVQDGDQVVCIHCDRESDEWKDKDANVTQAATYIVEGVCLGDNFIQIRNDKGQLDWYKTFKFQKVETGNEQEKATSDRAPAG